MKNILYVLLVIVFFNCSFLTLYYLKIFNNLGLNKLLIMNVIVLVLALLYTPIYHKYFLYKFSFGFIAFLGCIFGAIFITFIKNISIEEALFVITFTSFSLTFLSYSIYFDNKKELVFK